jgi:pyruvate,water dikinase
VDKRSRQIKEQRPGRKEVIIRPTVKGGTEQISSLHESTNELALAAQQVQKLSQVGIDIERHYGAPQDIEWAWINDKNERGKFFILQARPMTALPEPIKVSGPLRIVVPMLAEMWPTRPYPLDMTTFTGAVERAIGSFLVTLIGKSAPNPDEMFLEEDGVIVQFKPPRFHPSVGILFTPWVTFWRTRGYNPTTWESDPLLGEIIARSRAIEKRDLRSLTWMENLDLLHEALALIPRVMELRERYFPRALLGLGGLWLLLRLAGHNGRFSVLVSGISTKTTETNQALETLAAQIRSDSSLDNLFRDTGVHELLSRLKDSKAGQAFLERFEAFLDQYGHRETALTVSQPAWKDQPEVVLGILKVLAETEQEKIENYDAWQRTRDELLRNSILGTRLLRNLFLTLLTNARAFFQIREDTHFYVTLVQPIIRHIVLELGRRLVEASALDKAEDILHLRLEELETFGKQWPPSAQMVARIREVVARRKARRESLANKPVFDPRLLTKTAGAQTGENVLLNGTSGSPGLARGPVKIVNDISEFGKLRAGDILVAPVTNPAWTPLFQRAIAVVVDTGGAASHAAIVAREYGIPAVMSTVNGTKELKDGQWIEVDGSRGLVLKAEERK